jgi:hypothetical protein
MSELEDYDIEIGIASKVMRLWHKCNPTGELVYLSGPTGRYLGRCGKCEVMTPKLMIDVALLAGVPVSRLLLDE